MTAFWLNGVIVAPNDAKISILDHGFTVGDGVFETVKVSDGQAFAFSRHLKRLQKSASGLGLGLIDLKHIQHGVQECLHEDPTAGRIRITVTSGVGPLGSGRGDSDFTIAVTTAPGSQWPSESRAVVVPWCRNERSCLVGIKSTSYAENAISLQLANKLGASEALYFDTNDRLSEGTGSNVFIVKDGEISTPSLDCGILEGITRDLVLEWSSSEGIEIHQRHITRQEVKSADEIFITSTTRDVMPVNSLLWVNESRTVDDEQSISVGKMTSKVQQLFATKAAQDMDP